MTTIESGHEDDALSTAVAELSAKFVTSVGVAATDVPFEVSLPHATVATMTLLRQSAIVAGRRAEAGRLLVVVMLFLRQLDGFR